MEKVYILVEEDVCENVRNFNMYAYKNKTLAYNKLKWFRNLFLENIYDTLDIESDDDDSFECYFLDVFGKRDLKNFYSIYITCKDLV